MYIDTVVVSGLIIVLLTCVVVAYVGRYAYRRMRDDKPAPQNKE